MKVTLPERDYQAYIFDCDGTLIDSMPLHYRAWNHGIRLAGGEGEIPEEYFYRSAGKPLLRVLQELQDDFGWVLDPKAVEYHKEKYFAENASELKAFPDVLEHLLEADSRSFPTAIASGSAREAVYHALRAAGLENVPQVIVSIDDVKVGKPAPDTFLLAAQLLEVQPADCLVFEDGISGVEAAKACGMDYVWVDARRGVL